MKLLSMFLVAVLTCLLALETQADIIKEAPRKRAFLVGVPTYQHPGLRQLNYPGRDVQRLAELLERRCGYENSVTVVTTQPPTLTVVKEALSAFLATVGPDDTILVYFSGHGVPFENNVGLAMWDSNPKDPTSFLLSSTLTTELTARDGGRQLLILDCCHAAGEAGAINKAFEKDKLVVFCSCRGEEKSWEWGRNQHGLFTWYLLEGLQGFSTPNRINDIPITALSAYVTAKVLSETQTPLNGFTTQTPVLFPPQPDNFVVSTLSTKTWSEKKGMKFIDVLPGDFEMGSPGTELNRKLNEKQHSVTISRPFRLGVYEVTNDEYANMMGTERPELGRRPVTKVTWYDAITFCNKLSEANLLEPCYVFSGAPKYEELNGKRVIKEANVAFQPTNGFRLPTEAEWEYACRAGTSTATGFGYCLDWDKVVYRATSPYCDSNADMKPGPAPKYAKDVGSSGYSNFWGFHDMHGNVAEWCNDSWQDDYYTTVPPLGWWKDPMGPNLNQMPPHVVRGGGFDWPGYWCRSAFRFNYGKGGKFTSLMNDNVGFRVCTWHVK